MYKKILVPLDGSELAECVLHQVESVAKGCSAESVTFLRVAEPVHIPVSGEYDGYTFNAKDWQQMETELKAAAEHYLNQLLSRVKYDGIKTQSVVMSGRAAESIAEYANKNGVDLIAIATHGRSGISRWVWGSVADRVLRSASVPVLMIRAPGYLPGSI